MRTIPTWSTNSCGYEVVQSRLGALGHGYYSIGVFFSISAPLRFVNWSKYENQSSLLSRHFMLWLYNGTFYLTDDGAENSQSAVHSG